MATRLALSSIGGLLLFLGFGSGCRSPEVRQTSWFSSTASARPSQPPPPPLPPLRDPRRKPSFSSYEASMPPLIRLWMPLTSWASQLPEKTPPRLSACRRELVRQARTLLGQRAFRCSPPRTDGALYWDDCVGFLRCLFQRIGVDVFENPFYQGNSGTYTLFHYFRAQGLLYKGEPSPGDVVFWHGTIDRNRNGRLNDDPITHVGIVEAIDPDGRLQILHAGYKPNPGVNRIYMYLKDPSLASAPLEKPYWERQVKYYLASTAACNKQRSLYNSCQRRLSRMRYSSPDRGGQIQYCQRLGDRLQRVCRTVPYVTWKRATHRVYNSSLVGANKRRAHGHLTGELFAGFGSLRQCPLSSPNLAASHARED